MADDTYQLDRLAESNSKLSRDNRYLTIGICCLAILVTLTSIIALSLALREDKTSYFAVTPDLRIQELAPLKEPTVTDTGLRDWVARTVSSTLSINFLNWKEQLSSVSDSYTKECFEQVFKNLDASGNLKYVVDKRLSCAAIISKPPVIIQRGLLQGTYVWDLQVPVRVTFESSSRVENAMDWVVSVRVTRVASTRNALGIAISQLILQ
jgi:intracellular multiplication protein IcmL